MIGLSVFPTYWLVRVMIQPSAIDAMGVVAFYDESYAGYTFLGDHSYSLKFPGDRAKFLQFANQMGLADHKISDNEFRIDAAKKHFSRGVTFHPDENLTTIHYFSSSQ